jgi:hypothetical protein
MTYGDPLWHHWYGLKHRGFLRWWRIAMEMAEVTTRHALGTGKLELSPSLEAKSSSLGNSSRMAHSDGDPLQAMPRLRC